MQELKTRNKFLSSQKFMKSKKGALSTGMINQAILAIVLLVVLFKLYAELVPEAQTAGDELNSSGVPFGSLFSGSGVVFIVIMAALIIVVVRSFLGGKK